ncbi:MAG: RNA pseudouridine synthase [Spirochaetales bacterium]|nr:RNA pseudouridine synthase [Spirochaetales bacterium]
MMDLEQFPDVPDRPAIIAETGRWLVARKPAFLHTVRSGGGRDPNPSLAEWLEGERPECASAGKVGEAGLLQRLDFDTSGLVLAAKDRTAFEWLWAASTEGRFLKAYALRCAPGLGGLEGSRPGRAFPGCVEEAAWNTALEAGDAEELARLLGSSGGASIVSRFRPYGPGARRVACLAPGAEPGLSRAWTRDGYSTAIEALLARPASSLLGVASLRRGFRHQIRAHFAWMGLPLDGDGLYGGRDDTRLRLHAALLEFPDPADGSAIRVVDPVVAALTSIG